MELKLPYAPESRGDTDADSLPPSPSLCDTDSLLHSVAGRLQELTSTEVIERWNKSTLSWQPLDPMIPSPEGETPDRLHESWVFSNADDISVVTLPVSSADSLLPKEASPREQLVLARGSPLASSASRSLWRSGRFGLPSLLTGETFASRLLIILLTVLSLVRPANDGTLLKPPVAPVDYVELVSAPSIAANMTHMPTGPDLLRINEGLSLSSTISYLAIAAVVLYSISKLAYRPVSSRSLEAGVRSLPRRARLAAPAAHTRSTAPRIQLCVPRMGAELPTRQHDGGVNVCKEEMSPSLVPEQIYNVCLLGGAQVGISSLLSRQLFGSKVDCLIQHVDESYRQAYKKKGAPTVTLELCDWHLQKTRQRVGRMGVHVAVVVFALDDQASLAEALGTVKQVRAMGKETGQLKAIYLVANKADLAEQAGPSANVRLAATRRRAEEFATEMGISVYECSAKTGEGVRDLFRAVARNLRNL